MCPVQDVSVAPRSGTATLPNLIIAGAPRSGTTALFSWLDDHPDVCGFPTKEVRFFLDEDYPNSFDMSHYAEGPKMDYRSYFGSWVRPTCQFVMDGTPDYMYQRRAMAEIPQLASQPKVVFVVRRPEDRVQSAYQFFSNSIPIIKSGCSFAEFVDQSLACADDPSRNDQISAVVRHSMYVIWLRMWRERLPTTRFHVIVLEDLFMRPQVVMSKLCQFLGLDADYYRDHTFPRVNESKNVRNKRLQGVVSQLVVGFPALKRLSLLRQIYRRLNSSPKQSPPTESLPVMQKLAEWFEPYDRQLADEFKLDLSPWFARRSSSLSDVHRSQH
jgi:hypothetical protein